jgi:L-threonylcarbamoyladenylate synthase
MKSNSLTWQTESVVDQAYVLLTRGSVLLTSTDTVFGLLTCANQEGHDALDKLKGRKEKPYLILFDSQESIVPFITPLSLQMEKFIKKCWPGPVTMIFKVRESVPSYMKSSEETIAIRVPDHHELQLLLAKTGPLFSTSANKTGKPIPLTINEVDPDMVQSCALIINDNKSHMMTSSTILDCTKEPISVVREGAFSVSALEELYGKPF